MKDLRILVWLKNDLRIHDNEILWRACKQGIAIPVFVLDPEFQKPTTLGFPRMDSFRFRFLTETLANLRSSLQAHGSNLIIRTGNPVDILYNLALELQCRKLLTAREVAPYERNQIDQVEARLMSKGIMVETSWQNTLFHLEDIPWPIQHLPQTFTDFRKELEQEATVRPEFEIPEFAVLPEIDFGEIPQVPENDTQNSTFKGGEDQALTRLNYYLWDTQKVLTYKETRDGFLGTEFSTRLSPWLANGSISPRRIYHELKRFESTIQANESTYWVVFELLWRDFFRFTAKKFGQAIFQLNGITRRKRDFYPNTHEFNRWIHGETSVDLIDANMRELRATGWMSNRGRQVVASFLAKELEVDWTWGAMWFESKLIDYDVASNWLNWAYLAGVGNDPRQDRKFTIETQQLKYDPEFRYVSTWLGKPLSVKSR